MKKKFTNQTLFQSLKDYVREHFKIGASRLSDENKLNDWGSHYNQKEKYWGAIYDDMLSKAINVIQL